MATVEDRNHKTDILNTARLEGYEIVTIPGQIKQDISNSKDIDNKDIKDLYTYIDEYNDSFEYEFIYKNELSTSEKEVWSMRDKLFNIVNKPENVKEIKISKTIRIVDGKESARGVWESDNGRIILKRTVLNTPQQFIETLLNQIVYAKSNAQSMNRHVEIEFTEMLGKFGYEYIKNN